jgi:hypothetical protein
MQSCSHCSALSFTSRPHVAEADADASIPYMNLCPYAQTEIWIEPAFPLGAAAIECVAWFTMQMMAMLIELIELMVVMLQCGLQGDPDTRLDSMDDS